MGLIIAEETICVEPRFLNKDFKTYVYQKICNQMVGDCNNDYGYVLAIKDDLQILNNILSTTGPGIFIKVKFTLETMKPEKGQEYKGKVGMVFQHGIFVEIGKMKVLIPTDKMNGYKFDKTNELFKKKSKTILNGSEVTVIIDLIKYENKNFSCIGILKDNI